MKNNTDPYEEVKALSDAMYAGTLDKATALRDMVALLQRRGIRLRQDDGTLAEVTFSVAKSRPDTLVVGLRYLKRKGDYSEDTFLFTEGAGEIEKCYRGDVERKLPEYEDTHKRPPSSGQPPTASK